MRHRINIGPLSWILILCLGAMGCSGLFRNYGTINPAAEVTRSFEAYRVNGEYRYYASGAFHYPSALMGLHRDYRLDPKTLWREVPGMTAARMEEIVEGMRTKAGQHNMFQYGFVMSDDKGRPVGVWYSVLWAPTFLRMNADGTVRIDTPAPDVYTRLENDAQGGDSLY